MNQFLLFIIIILFTNITIFCQPDWKKGFVITKSNDTLMGEINQLVSERMSEECQFRSGPQQASVTYTPNDINGYFMPNTFKYVAIKLETTEMVFLEYLVKGKLDLYYLRSDDNDRYFIKTDSLPLREIKYIEEYRNDNGNTYLYESTFHVGLLSLYTKDAPNLNSRILKIKPDFTNLRNFVVDYHNKVCKDEKCIVFRNKEAYTKIAFGPHFGQANQSYFNGTEMINKNYLAYGLYLRLWSPRVNKNLFIRTGAIFSKFNFYTRSIEQPMAIQTIFKIPIHIEYVIPTSFVLKPKGSVGFDYYSNSAFYFGASIGTDVVIHKNYVLSLSYEREIGEIHKFSYGTDNYSSILAGFYYHF